MLLRGLVLSLLCFALLGCGEQVKQELKIAINPWPGYEFLYLAKQKGFFEQVGLEASFLQFSSLSDAQRAYLNGYANAMTSTLIEVVQSEVLGKQPLKVVLVTDYSNGGDVIVTSKSIASVSGLKGKTIGCEVSSLGIFVLQRALAKAGLTLEDVSVVNVEQNAGEPAMLEGQIDAYVSYPPVSVNILKHENMHTVFSSADIPGEVIDIVSISESYLKSNPGVVAKIRKAWGLALEYYRKNPQEALDVMAKRESITPDDFKAVLSGLSLFSAEDQKSLFSQPDKLQASAVEVCITLNHIGAIETDCATLPNIVYSDKR